MVQRNSGLLIILVLWVILLSASLSALPARAQSTADPLVLAFYYTWFDENTWTYDKLSDLPAEQYVSRDRGVMGRHIDQAKAAGIDALVVAWYGPNGNQTETNLAALLEEAAARNFKIAILFETDSPFLGGDLTGALSHALSVHANQPAYLRADGRPVIFFWRNGIYGIDTWRNVRGAVDPGYSSLWINEGVDTSFLSVFDGHYLYSNTWNPPADLTYTNQKFASRVAAARESFGAGKLWVATVMPGYNDVRVRPGVGFATDREGGAYFQRSWNAAIASNPNWIVITSFNEWPEGTYIEPSAAFGNQYIGLSAAGSSQFKAGGGGGFAAAAAPPPPPPPAEPATPVPTATPRPTPTSPTAFVINAAGLNLRTGPGTDYDVLSILPSGATLPIVGSDPAFADWWQVDAGGTIGWVSAGLVEAAGPLEQVAAVSFVPLVLPTPTPAANIVANVISITLPPPAPARDWQMNPFLQWEK